MSGTLQPLEAYARITKLPENTVRFLSAFTVPQRTRFLSGLPRRLHIDGSTYTQNVSDHD